jgi:nucleotide-binding universal stress UspA family protein
MHVLIATDGALDNDAATRFAVALAGNEGEVTVMTVIEVNRNLLRDLRAIYGERHPPPVDRDAEYVSAASGDAEVAGGWPGDDEMIERYLADQREQRAGPLATALSEAGLRVDVRAVEGEDAAGAIIGAARELNADVLCVGSHGRGFFDGLLGSTGTKLARRSPCPVLLLRSE